MSGVPCNSSCTPSLSHLAYDRSASTVESGAAQSAHITQQRIAMHPHPPPRAPPRAPPQAEPALRLVNRPNAQSSRVRAHLPLALGGPDWTRKSTEERRPRDVGEHAFGARHGSDQRDTGTISENVVRPTCRPNTTHEHNHWRQTHNAHFTAQEGGGGRGATRWRGSTSPAASHSVESSTLEHCDEGDGRGEEGEQQESVPHALRWQRGDEGNDCVTPSTRTTADVRGGRSTAGVAAGQGAG